MSFDPHYNSVSLLLHCDGANGSATFVDSSPSPKTLTVFGSPTPVLSTAQAKFGASSLLVNAANGIVAAGIEADSSADFDFGIGDFTIEWRQYWVNQGYPLYQAAFQRGYNASGAMTLVTGNADARYALILGTGTAVLNESSPGPANAWTHYALTRSGNNFTLWRGGVASASGSSALSVGVDRKFAIGCYASDSGALGQVFNGYIDEFRITKGVARYTANFTPPTEAFAEAAVAPALQARIAIGTPLSEAQTLAQAVAAARIAAPAPLGAVQAQAATIAPALAYTDAPSPLSAVQAKAFFGQTFFARSKAPAVFGDAQAQAVLVRAVRAAAPSVLGTVSAMADAWPLVQTHAAAPSPLGNAAGVAMVAPMAYASTSSPLSEASAFAMTTVSAYATAPAPLGMPAAPAVHVFFDDGFTHTLGAVPTFGAATATAICYAADSIQLASLIPQQAATQFTPPGTVAAQQQQPIAAPVFGTPSVSFVTSHPATSLEASAAFGVAVVRAVHEAASLEPVVFGDVGAPAYSAPAGSLFGQSTFGQPVAVTAHPLGDWYAGIRMGPVGASTFGSLPILDSIESTEFGQPYLGATIHRAMPLHAMPQFGPITISRSHAC